MAGGAGVEWYFGYRNEHDDLGMEDWRSRAAMWRQSRAARGHPVRWYDPRNGGALQAGSRDWVRGPGPASLGTPPGRSGDWVALVEAAP